MMPGLGLLLSGRGAGREGGGGSTRILVLPSHRQPKSIGGGETLGLIYGFTQRDPPPTSFFEGWWSGRD